MPWFLWLVSVGSYWDSHTCPSTLKALTLNPIYEPQTLKLKCFCRSNLQLPNHQWHEDISSENMELCKSSTDHQPLSPSLIVAEWHRQRQRALKWSIWFLMVFASEWATSAQHSSSSQTLEAWLSRTGILIMTGGECQRWFVTTRVKGKVHKMAVRPGAIHVVWLWQKDKLRMLRF